MWRSSGYEALFPQEYCKTDWSVLEDRFRKKLYPYADLHRLKSVELLSSHMTVCSPPGLYMTVFPSSPHSPAGPSVPSLRGCLSCYTKVLAFLPIAFSSELQQKSTSTMYTGL